MSGPRMGISHLNGGSSGSSNSSSSSSSSSSHNLNNPRNRSNNPTVNLINRIHTTTNEHHRPTTATITTQIISSQHDELIKYHHESWTKISQEIDRHNSGTSVIFYQEQDASNLSDFQPFNLDAFCNRRCTPSSQQLPKS